MWAAAVALATGCGGSSAPLLSNTYPSPEALATAVMGAVERRDATALRALALNEQEFRDHVWPELPAARPERNLPFSYVWGDLRQKSEEGLALTLERLFRLRHLHRGTHPPRSAIELLWTFRLDLATPAVHDTS